MRSSTNELAGIQFKVLRHTLANGAWSERKVEYEAHLLHGGRMHTCVCVFVQPPTYQQREGFAWGSLVPHRVCVLQNVAFLGNKIFGTEGGGGIKRYNR